MIAGRTPPAEGWFSGGWETITTELALGTLEEPDARIMTALPQSHQGTISFTSYAVLTGQPLLAWRDVTGEELAAAIPEHKPTMVMAITTAAITSSSKATPPLGSPPLVCVNSSTPAQPVHSPASA